MGYPARLRNYGNFGFRGPRGFPFGQPRFFGVSASINGPGSGDSGSDMSASDSDDGGDSESVAGVSGTGDGSGSNADISGCGGETDFRSGAGVSGVDGGSGSCVSGVAGGGTLIRSTPSATRARSRTVGLLLLATASCRHRIPASRSWVNTGKRGVPISMV